MNYYHDENDDEHLPPPPPPHDGEGRPPIPHNPTPLMLANEIAKIFENMIRNDGLNMTNSARLLMMFLARREGPTQLELANMARIKAPTVSVTLQKMESEGYVRRESDVRDQRQTRVYLTERGKDFNKRVCERIHELDKNALVGFSDEEKAQAVELLRRIVINMVEYGGHSHPDEQKDS